MTGKGKDSDLRRQARRRLLQLLSVGGLVGAGRLLPKEWVRPVVDEVMLPAHAQLTNGPPPDDVVPDLDPDTTDDGP